METEKQEIQPDGTFEEWHKARCGCSLNSGVKYFRNRMHIEARCDICNAFLGYVSQYNTLEKWSRKIKTRDGYRCQRCGKALSPATAEAHHPLQRYLFPQDKYVFNINNGITLCKECHDMADHVDPNLYDRLRAPKGKKGKKTNSDTITPNTPNN